ncbi:hypothetical protein BC937DRAFT_91418 [Endogone sp. FLAS-F59071]|nr:hypothetical protein BC937DRAFT_91418 [Endogone sp. FLAS-F59071]|eukprot:RUS16271.1 hypothetical protein BC937DRAFT_91418 [Endogone sp. FLAS-F59071]
MGPAFNGDIGLFMHLSPPHQYSSKEFRSLVIVLQQPLCPCLQDIMHAKSISLLLSILAKNP